MGPALSCDSPGGLGQGLLSLTGVLGLPPYLFLCVCGDRTLNGVMAPVVGLGVAGSGYGFSFPTYNYSSIVLCVSRGKLFIT